MNLSDLKPAPFNPREIDAAAIKGLGTSIAEFGDISGIVWNKANGYLVAGHQRLKVLLERHAEKEAELVDDVIETDDGGRFPIRVVDWPDAKHKAAMVVANSPLIAGVFLGDQLVDMVDELKESDLAGLIEPLRLEELVDDLRPPVEAQQDEVPEPPKEPVTRPGDLWTMGEHRVLCGDSTKAEDVERLMAGGKADLLLTDPPYGIAYIPETSRLAAKGGLVSDKPYPDGFDVFALWLDGLLGIAIEQIRAGGCYYIWMGWSHLGTVEAAMRTRGHTPKDCIVWDRIMPRMTKYPQDYLPCVEFCLYGWVRGAKHINNNPTEAMRTTIWHVKRLNASDMEHTTQKPIALGINAILMSSKPEHIILDVCLGSGWALIAAHQLGRRCYGIEIEPRYVDVICQRFLNLTGESPIRESDGARFADLTEQEMTDG